MTTTQTRKPTLKDRLTGWAGKRSPWVLHINTGSCNGCDIEIVDSLTPRFDVERFGVRLVDTPRHADVLLVTGPVTRQMAPRLKRLYDQTPEPRYVIAVGTCATSGGVFHSHYNTLGGVDQVIPVDMYIPGCPVAPEALIDAIYKLLEGEDLDEAELPAEARLERPESMESLPEDAIAGADEESPPKAIAEGDER
ncbi:MAG TPA: NADH-quinone oxidoreductase subunit B family protein [Natrialbaceae archaeon]|nr:NADH-quinone oxidoreductase subunit B family protein [Natrialbaceae archaeon]